MSNFIDSSTFLCSLELIDKYFYTEKKTVRKFLIVIKFYFKVRSDLKFLHEMPEMAFKDYETLQSTQFLGASNCLSAHVLPIAMTQFLILAEHKMRDEDIFIWRSPSSKAFIEVPQL